MSTKIQSSFILTIDIGTQSIRCSLFNIQGIIVKKNQVSLKKYTSSNIGYMEQDADYFWNIIIKSIQEILVSNKLYSNNLIGISVTTQRLSMLPVDKEGKPLRKVIFWQDKRSNDIFTVYKKLPLYFRIAINFVGLKKTVQYFISKAHSNWISQNEPNIWSQVYKYIPLSTYIIYKLSNQFVDSSSSLVGYIPLDYKNKKWGNRFYWKWKATGLNINQLPKVVEPGTIIGYLSDTIKKILNISDDIPIVASGSDKACEALGNGCLEDNVAALSLGTGISLIVSNKKYISAEKWLPAYPAALPNYYNTEYFIYSGFETVTWFKNEFAFQEVQFAKQENKIVEAYFDTFLENTPVGNLGLLFHPIASSGKKGINKLQGQGGFIGLTREHTKENIYRAIIEGFFYEIKYGKYILEKRNNNKKIKNIYVSGGGSQSSLILQIAADILGIPIISLSTHETSSVGAMINVAVALNKYENYFTAVENIIKKNQIFYPNLQNYQLYNKIYKKKYLKISKLMKKNI